MRVPKALPAALTRGARARAATPLTSTAGVAGAAARHAAHMSLTSRLIRSMARSPEQLRELERAANSQPGDQATQAVYLETLQECVGVVGLGLGWCADGVVERETGGRVEGGRKGWGRTLHAHQFRSLC